MVNINDYKGKHLHFIGVGGCSMNGLAEIMHSKGYSVSGCDRVESSYTQRLRKLGVDIFIGHDASHITGADLIVYSAAIKDSHVEMAEAIAKGIPTIDRASLLGQITGQFSNVIGVSGCHGKTTITSMIAIIFKHAGKNATMHVGGEVPFMEGGTYVGTEDLLLTEACEYVESFLKFHPTIEIINNIDDDHLDYFRDIDHIYSAFQKYVALLPPDGLLIGCADDRLVMKLLEGCPCKTITYGLTDAMWTASDIRYDDFGSPSFQCMRGNEPLGRVELNIPGEHNIVNALAAIATACELKVPFEACKSALSDYRLAARRFEYYGEVDGVKIFHDYAHHPNEIKACLKGASKYPHKKLWCVFQCNSYTRAKTLYDKYSTAFSYADSVLVPDIYPGREVDTGLIHAKDLVRGIGANSPDCRYLGTFAEIKSYLKAHWQPGDMVIALGSGDVFRQIRILFDK